MVKKYLVFHGEPETIFSKVVGVLYFKRGQNNKVRLTLMTIIFIGLILKINILPSL